MRILAQISRDGQKLEIGRGSQSVRPASPRRSCSLEFHHDAGTRRTLAIAEVREPNAADTTAAERFGSREVARVGRAA